MDQGVVTLCGVREDALSVDEVVAAVSSPDCGGLVVFLGLVRDHDGGRQVVDLDYSAHPTAGTVLEEVAGRVAARTSARLAVTHRVGHLEVGDLAVVVAAAAAHRGEAFSACRDLIDTLKETVPIWKHQHFVGGGDSWVGLP